MVCGWGTTWSPTSHPAVTFIPDPYLDFQFSQQRAHLRSSHSEEDVQRSLLGRPVVDVSGFHQKRSRTRAHRSMHTRQLWDSDCRLWPAGGSFFTGWGSKDTGWKGITSRSLFWPPSGGESVVSLLQTAPGKGLELSVAQVSLEPVRICPLSCGSGCPFSRESQSLAGVFLDHGRQYGRRTVSQPLNHPLGRALVLSGRHIREFLGLGLETNGGTDGGCFLCFLFYVFVLFLQSTEHHSAGRAWNY
uniref:Uncharacterized protein n=1 Tax=Myotis myotis TaxID=51298 RepID=A0A7J7S206_MYOMY|nr:hypothetical protein mMyoMyo1_010044 [Myotis myotis]